MTALHFHELFIKRVTPEAAGAVVLSFAIPPELRDHFDFQPGQFLTLRAMVEGRLVRRSYSICSAHARLAQAQEIDVGIKPVAGGLFSTWAAAKLRPGDRLEVMPPQGRFTPRSVESTHRLGVHRACFAAGSGITPMLSILASTLASDSQARFTLVYGNQRLDSILFHEALQDLKDRYPTRLALLHVLSRQPQEIELFNGRLDQAKVAQLLNTVLPVAGIDEAFICGPEGMIDATESALLAAGLPRAVIHAERFLSPDQEPARSANAQIPVPPPDAGAATTRLELVLDGKTHTFTMDAGQQVLDVGLLAGLDLPYSCKGGVCCTCRARVLEGQVRMERNFTLEPWEIDKGFVLTCQARPLTPRVVVSYDER